MREDVGVKVTVHTSLLGGEQPDSSKEKLRSIIQSLDAWGLAGGHYNFIRDAAHVDDRPSALERVTYTTKSFIIALALVKGRIDAEQAAQAALVEVNSQIEKWGEVEDCG